MQIIVNGIKWKIEITNNPNDLLMPDGTVRLGLTDTETKEVFISNKISGRLFEKVLIHELTHVWLYSYRYEFDIEIEEAICSFVDTFSYDIIQTTEYVLQGL